MTRRTAPSNEQVSGPAQNVVRTKFSGILISLPSEGMIDVEGEVRYSPGFMTAFLTWSSAKGIRKVSRADRAEAVGALAAEVQTRFGVDRPTAATLAANFVRVAD